MITADNREIPALGALVGRVGAPRQLGSRTDNGPASGAAGETA
jgi:hypothetical protein